MSPQSSKILNSVFYKVPNPPAIFINREKEIKKFLSKLDTDKVIILYGLPGIGKSTLIAKAFSNPKFVKSSILYLDFKQLNFPNIPIALKKIFKIKTAKSKNLPNPHKIIDCIDSKSLIIIADHIPGNETNLDFLRTCARYLKTGKIIASINELIKFSFKDFINMSIMTLPLLKTNDVLKILENILTMVISQNNKTLFELAKWSSGYPLLIIWIAEYIFEKQTTEDENKIKEFVLKRFEKEVACFFNNLSRQAKDLLEILVLSRKPLSCEELSKISNKDVKHTLFTLKQLGLIYKINEARYVAPEYSKKILQLKARNKHKLLGDYFIKSDSLVDRIEAIYHYLQVKNFKKVEQHLENLIRNLIEKGYFNEVLELINQLNDKFLTSYILLVQASILEKKGRTDNAIVILKNIVNSKANITDKVKALCKLAEIYFELGKLKKADECIVRAMELSAKEKCPENLSKIHSSLSMLLWNKGLLKESEFHLKKAINFAFEEGNMRQVLDLKEKFALLKSRQGELKIAKKMLEEAVQVEREIGNNFTLALCLSDLATVCSDMGKLDEAENILKEVLELLKEVDDKRSTAIIYNNLGLLYIRGRKLKEAETAIKQAFEISHTCNDAFLVSAVLNNIALLNFNKGKIDIASEYLNKSLKIISTLNRPTFHIFAILNSMKLHLLSHDFLKAKELLQLAYELSTDNENLYVKFILYKSKGVYLKETGQFEEAEVLLKKCAKFFKDSEYKYEYYACFAELVECFIFSKKLKEAYELINQSYTHIDLFIYPEPALKVLIYFDIMEKNIEGLLNLYQLADERHMLEYKAKILIAMWLIDSKNDFFAKNWDKTFNTLHYAMQKNIFRWAQILKKIFTSYKGPSLEPGSTCLSDFKFTISTNEGKKMINANQLDKIYKNINSYDIVMDVVNKKLIVKGKGEIDIFKKRILAPLLLYFLNSSNKIINSEELLKNVWQINEISRSDKLTVVVNITRLRKIIEPDPKLPRLIITVQDSINESGYRLNPAVRYCIIERIKN